MSWREGVAIFFDKLMVNVFNKSTLAEPKLNPSWWIDIPTAAFVFVYANGLQNLKTIF